MQALVFDLDGTLVDSRADLAGAVNAALAAAGHPGPPQDAIVRHIGRGARHLLRQVLPDEVQSEAEVERLLPLFRTHYLAHLADETRPYEGIPEVLSRLVSEGVPLGVVTNKPGEAARHLLRALDLDAYFRVVVAAEEGRPLKPAPDGLLAALGALGVAPKRAVYVGDLPLDVETARRAGCRAAAVRWGYGAREAVVAAGPDLLVERPADLPAVLTQPGPRKAPGSDA